jgi:hypothetical protein
VWSGYLNVECVNTIQKLLNKAYKWGLTVKLYKKDELFSARDEKLFESMKLSNHCLYHLLPQQRNVGHNLRNRGHSFELIVHNYKSTRSCFVVRTLFDYL